AAARFRVGDHQRLGRDPAARPGLQRAQRAGRRVEQELPRRRLDRHRTGGRVHRVRRLWLAPGEALPRHGSERRHRPGRGTEPELAGGEQAGRRPARRRVQARLRLQRGPGLRRADADLRQTAGAGRAGTASDRAARRRRTERKSLSTAPATGSGRRRARELGIALGTYATGRFNAITDVRGVLVGHTTLVRGKGGPPRPGSGPVRTGVTAILPRAGNVYDQKAVAGGFVLNGAGELS